MAKREENLKKINAELEMMSEEELDNVAGGTMTEVNEIVMSVGKIVEHSGTYNGKPAKILGYLDGKREFRQIW